MGKYELTVTKDYVHSWTYLEAIRELFQNSLDQQEEDKENKMFFEYNQEEKTLRVGNKKSVLAKNTLLLGSTTKEDKENQIGKHGEGYKLATLVLERENKPVTIYNYGEKEVWRPRFVKSRRYNAEILTFFIDKKFPWQTVPNYDLVIEVENIDMEEYEQIKERNLHLVDVGEVYETSKGRILLEDRYKGKIFVKGLYVQDYNENEEELGFGYDFEPRIIKLDRDRGMVKSFEFKWETGSMWKELEKGVKEKEQNKIQQRLLNLVKSGNIEIEYYSIGGTFAETAYQDFKGEYGENALPVTTNYELEDAKETYPGTTPVIVPSKLKTAIEISKEFRERIENIEEKGHIDQLWEWHEDVREKLTDEENEKFIRIFRGIDRLVE